MGSFVAFTVNARVAVVADKASDLQPDVETADHLKGSILTEMASKGMIMVVSKNLDAKCVGSTLGVRNVDALVKQ